MLVNNLLIKRVDEVKGTSQATGNEWKKKNVLLEFEDDFGTSYINAGCDVETWETLGFQEGQVVSLNLKFRTKVFPNSFISNDIRIVKPNLKS